MSKNLLISKLDEKDIDSFARILDEYRVFYGRSSNIKESIKYVEDNFHNDKVIFLVGKNNAGECIGFCTLFESLSTVQATKILILNDLYIAQKYRRNSYATELLDYTIKLAEQIGVSFLKLETAENNIVAQKCYKKNKWHKLNFAVYGYTI